MTNASYLCMVGSKLRKQIGVSHRHRWRKRPSLFFRDSGNLGTETKLSHPRDTVHDTRRWIGRIFFPAAKFHDRDRFLGWFIRCVDVLCGFRKKSEGFLWKWLGCLKILVNSGTSGWCVFDLCYNKFKSLRVKIYFIH